MYPAPRPDGREYLVQANAIKINPLSVKHHTGQTLMEKKYMARTRKPANRLADVISGENREKRLNES
ncbi:hypothetical protein [Candidatus Williamhamiltonella defendens]|uniref:hypothetical protein n=1 Tax=Candidatus Williamhamiltonella defendens TaxID=138072 RepID=UPI001E416873|nr:hypothetical protein [Candidatus Hamiltonella defensa]